LLPTRMRSLKRTAFSGTSSRATNESRTFTVESWRRRLSSA
jgi:hypothetical protein